MSQEPTMTPALVPITVVVSPRAVDQRSSVGYIIAAKMVPPTTRKGDSGLVRQNQSTRSANGKYRVMISIVKEIPTITSKTECMPDEEREGGVERGRGRGRGI